VRVEKQGALAIATGEMNLDVDVALFDTRKAGWSARDKAIRLNARL
jgi:hypothetical protein